MPPQIIRIKPAKASAKSLAALERRNLIKVVKPTAKVVNTRTETGAVDVLYRSDNKYGGHSLLGIGKRNVSIVFSFHPDNEDLILLKPAGKKYKPLYFVASYLKSAEFLKALKKGKLASKDFTAIELQYNEPETMFFTVLKGTVHCEVTVPGPGQHPVFFVTESAELEMKQLYTDKYVFKIRK